MNISYDNLSVTFSVTQFILPYHILQPINPSDKIIRGHHFFLNLQKISHRFNFHTYVAPGTFIDIQRILK